MVLKTGRNQGSKKNCNSQAQAKNIKSKKSGTPSHGSTHDLKDYIIIGMTGVFCLLFVTFAIYAMVSSNADILQKTSSLLWWSLIAILAWAFDKSILPYLMKIFNDETRKC